ncbi:hypothetical protein BDV3_002722 [Batrachochytrium dendrobatidis]|nr:hypothetical protein QVD99_003220 [Batrachochytrium dendrobatidis]
MTGALVIIMAVMAVFISAESSFNSRGVHPSKLHLYQLSTTQFTCLDKSATISMTAVNDDYCDCADGSDEPGTSACANSSFYCKNVGHIGQSIPSSRVNDGVCDPECCDGSDEFSGSTKCPNNCIASANAYKINMEAEMAIINQGVKQREQLIAHAEAGKSNREEQAKALGRTIKVANQRISTFKDILEQAKVYEKQRIQKENLDKKIACATRLQDLRNEYKHTLHAAQSIQSKHHALVDAITKLYTLPESIRNDPIIQSLIDVANLNGIDSAEIIPSSDSQQLENIQDYTVDEIEQVLPDPCNDTDVPFGVCVAYSVYYSALYIKDGILAPVHWSGWKWLYQNLMEMGDPDAIYKNPNQAREMLQNAERDLQTMQNQLDDIVNMDKLDMGPHHEWEGLYKKCIKFVAPEYTYEVCPLETVKQIIKGEGDVTLGSFTRWGRRDTTKPSEPYTAMMFENGQQCWNGPSRSVELVLRCGTEFKIVSVNEPSKCEYYMEATSPTVCKRIEVIEHDKTEL